MLYNTVQSIGQLYTPFIFIFYFHLKKRMN